MTYNEAIEKLGNRNVRKVGNNTLLLRFPNGNVALRLHNTHILVFHPNGTVQVNTGGWRTVTTKARINEYLPCHAGLTQKDFTWYWSTGDGVTFEEGDVVTAEGHIERANGAAVMI